MHAVMLKHPIASYRQMLCRKMSEQMKIHSTSMLAVCSLSYEYSFLSEDLKILLPSSRLCKADSSIGVLPLQILSCGTVRLSSLWFLSVL